MYLLKAYISRIVCLKPLKIDNMTSKVPYYILLKQKGDQYACFESFSFFFSFAKQRTFDGMLGTVSMYTMKTTIANVVF
jgi:hypothetical protein